MTGGGLTLWNAIAICETSTTSWPMGKLRMKDDLENRSKGQQTPFGVKSTSPVTENHYKNGYVNNKNFIMTNEDNSDTKYTINNDTNNHDARDLHE